MEYNFLKVNFDLINNYYLINNIEKYNLNNETETDTVLEFYTDILNLKENSTFYVNDLNKFFLYVAYYLLQSGFKNVKENLTTKTFIYSYKSGICSNMKIKNRYNTEIILINFHSKFGIEFADPEQNIKLVNYALKKNRNRISLGADAFNEFISYQLPTSRYKEFVAHKIIRNNEHYPILEELKELEEAKLYLAGYQTCKTGTFENIVEYDISSSYASQLLNDTPVGIPKYYINIEDVPRSYFKVINFSYWNINLKSNKIGFIEINAFGNLNLTQEMFNLFIENYQCSYKINYVIAFKTRKHVFDSFIYDNIIKGKVEETDKIIAKYNKNIGNSIVGYFGRKTTQETTNLKLRYNKLDPEKTLKTIDPIYLPLYLCVLDKAKSSFIKTLQLVKNKIVYANTDGFYTTHKIDLRLLNVGINQPIGNYREKSKFAVMQIEGINSLSAITESGEIVNTLSGMKTFDLITPDQHKQRDFNYYIDVPTSSGYIMRQILRPEKRTHQ